MSENTPSSTTTTEPNIYQAKSNGQRPPADEAPNEIFFDKKCGKFGTGKAFFKGCMEPYKTGEIKGLKCVGFGGTTGACDMDIKFIYGNSRNSEAEFISNQTYLMMNSFRAGPDNKTSSTLSSTTSMISSTTDPAVTSGYEPDGPVPLGFSYNHVCSLGPGRKAVLSDNITLPRKKMEEIIEFCRQEIYGPPASLPLWAILLIVFLVITAVSVSAALFWHYWLRKKLYSREHSNRSSALGSTFYTSAPFSSASAIPSSSASQQGPAGSRQSQASSQRPSSATRQPSGTSQKPSSASGQQAAASGPRQSFSGLRPSTTSRRVPGTDRPRSSSLSRSLTKRV